MNQWTSIKSTCKLSVCINKNLRWLNEQVKRVQKSTKEWHTVCFTRFSSVITMLALPLLFTYLTLSRYDFRCLCVYISSDVSSVNVCLLFSAGLNFSIKYVSYDSLKILLSSRITKDGIILKFPPSHVLIWPSTSIYVSLGCRICCLPIGI